MVMGGAPPMLRAKVRLSVQYNFKKIRCKHVIVLF